MRNQINVEDLDFGFINADHWNILTCGMRESTNSPLSDQTSKHS